ncbi:hypothetical protein [Metallosphaera hakonensis]|nr:hypothetical protein [Metallosphaera hakonensis]
MYRDRTTGDAPGDLAKELLGTDGVVQRKAARGEIKFMVISELLVIYIQD